MNCMPWIIWIIARKLLAPAAVDPTDSTIGILSQAAS